MPFEFGPRLNVSSNFSRAHYPFISVFRFYHRSSSLGRLCRVKRVRASRHAPARPAGSERIRTVATLWRSPASRPAQPGHRSWVAPLFP